MHEDGDTAKSGGRLAHLAAGVLSLVTFGRSAAHEPSRDLSRYVYSPAEGFERDAKALAGDFRESVRRLEREHPQLQGSRKVESVG